MDSWRPTGAKTRIWTEENTKLKARKRKEALPVTAQMDPCMTALPGFHGAVNRDWVQFLPRVTMEKGRLQLV